MWFPATEGFGEIALGLHEFLVITHSYVVVVLNNSPGHTHLADPREKLLSPNVQNCVSRAEESACL